MFEIAQAYEPRRCRLSEYISRSSPGPCKQDGDTRREHHEGDDSQGNRGPDSQGALRRDVPFTLSLVSMCLGMVNLSSGCGSRKIDMRYFTTKGSARQYGATASPSLLSLAKSRSMPLTMGVFGRVPPGAPRFPWGRARAAGVPELGHGHHRAWRCILAGVVEGRLNQLKAATRPASFAIASAREKCGNPCSKGALPTVLAKWDKRVAREGTRRGPEGSCMYSSIDEDRPSDAGGPRFDSQCPLFHQSHEIYEVYDDM